MPQDKDNKYRPRQKHSLPKDKYRQLCNIYNEQYLPAYNLNKLSKDEKARLFNVLYIAVVRSQIDGVFADYFVRAVFEEIREIVHGIPPYNNKSRETQERVVRASGYTNQMSAIIRYYYHNKLGRNCVQSIWVEQRGLYRK